MAVNEPTVEIIPAAIKNLMPNDLLPILDSYVLAEEYMLSKPYKKFSIFGQSSQKKILEIVEGAGDWKQFKYYVMRAFQDNEKHLIQSLHSALMFAIINIDQDFHHKIAVI